MHFALNLAGNSLPFINSTVSTAKPFADVTNTITVGDGKITFSVPQNAPFPVKIAFIEITPLQTQGDLEYKFSYDQYANLSDDSAFTYSWNSSGKLVSATRKNFAESPDDAPEKVTYSYDPLGRRVLVKYYGDENAPYKNQWRSFITVYNGFLPIEELYVNYQGSIAGVKAKYFYDNAGRLVKAELDTDFDGVLDQTCLTILDDRGTLIGVANESGELIEKLYYNSTGLMKSYSPDGTKWKPTLDKYGNQLRESKYLPFGWTGMYKDRFTGLYHTQFREYDPLHERWLTIDPAGYNDGLNLYHAYMGVNGVDVLGLLITNSKVVGGVPMVYDSHLERISFWGFGKKLVGSWRKAVGDELTGYFQKDIDGNWTKQTAILSAVGANVTTIKKGGDKALKIVGTALNAPFALWGAGELIAADGVLKIAGYLLAINTVDDLQSLATGQTGYEATLRYLHPDMSEDEVQARMSVRAGGNMILNIAGFMQFEQNYNNALNNTRSALMTGANNYKIYIPPESIGANTPIKIKNGNIYALRDGGSGVRRWHRMTSQRITKGGVLRKNANSYWRKQLKLNRKDLSKANIDLINDGYSPIVDEEYLLHHPKFAPFIEEVIELHHINYGPELKELPKLLHRGSGFYNIWH